MILHRSLSFVRACILFSFSSVLFLCASAVPSFAQVSNPSVVSVPSTPSACNTLPLKVVNNTANLYGTNGSGGCTAIGGGGSSAPPFAADVTASPYNAVCDGSHDDSAAIQAALDANAAIKIPVSSSGAVQCNFATTLVMCNHFGYNAIYAQGQILDYTGAADTIAIDATACPIGLVRDLTVEGSAETSIATVASAFTVENSYSTPFAVSYADSLAYVGGAGGIVFDTVGGDLIPGTADGPIQMAAGTAITLGAPLITLNGPVNNGLPTSTNTDNRGTLTLVAGTATYTFTAGPSSGAWTTAPICFIQNHTTLADDVNVTKLVTTSLLTITNLVNTSDTYDYQCSIGN